jgi:hypothetical protein
MNNLDNTITKIDNPLSMILSVEQILDAEYKVYNYLTDTGNESGTIIVHPDLSIVFDENKLFSMNDVSTKIIKLRDLIENGFISVGSTDIMDNLQIQYPHPVLARSTMVKPNIKGIYMHGSRKQLIAGPTNIVFDYDPVSDGEYDTEDNENINANEDNNISYDSNFIEQQTKELKNTLSDLALFSNIPPV